MVNFSKNWAGKLDWGIFTTVRLDEEDKYYYYFDRKGQKLPIEINYKKIGEAWLWDVQRRKLKNIPDWLKTADTGLAPADFDKLMEKFYCKNPSWKGEDTVMLLLLFVNAWPKAGEP